jgi:hypothetical protein
LPARITGIPNTTHKYEIKDKAMSRSMMTVGTVTVAMIGLALGMLVMRITNAPIAIAQDASKSQQSVVPRSSFAPHASDLQQTTEQQGPISSQTLTDQIAALDGESYLTPEERRNIAVYENCYRSVVHIATQAFQIDRFFRTATSQEGSGVVRYWTLKVTS